MKALITTELLRKLPPIPPGKKSLDIRDTKLTGFVLRERRSGKHSYLVNLGRGRWHTLGSVETLKPDRARSDARDALTDRDRGNDPIEKRREAKRAGLTLDAFLTEHYTPWITANRKSGAETAARIRSRFADFVNSPIGELTGFQIEKWRSARLKSGTTQSTVNRDVGALKAAIRRGVTWKLIARNPLADVKQYSVDHIGRLRYLSSAEETRLRKALEARDEKRRAERERANLWRRDRGYAEWPAFGSYSDHLTPLVLLALNTGCRFGELTGLEWGDVDLVGAILTVRSSSAKSGRARHVPLNSEAVDVLKAWQPDQVFTREHPPKVNTSIDLSSRVTNSTGELRDIHLVFPGHDGSRIGHIKTSWARLLKAAKITGFRFHDTRHTFASKLVQAGVDLNTVRELLGHADISMTLRYSHLGPEHRAAAVAKLVQR